MDIYELIAVLLQASHNGARTVIVDYDGDLWVPTRPRDDDLLIDEALVLELDAYIGRRGDR